MEHSLSLNMDFIQSPPHPDEYWCKVERGEDSSEEMEDLWFFFVNRLKDEYDRISTLQQIKVQAHRQGEIHEGGPVTEDQMQPAYFQCALILFRMTRKEVRPFLCLATPILTSLLASGTKKVDQTGHNEVLEEVVQQGESQASA